MSVVHVPASGSATANGAALQAAIDAAVLGDTITLDAGGVYQGNYGLPDKGAGTEFISIESVELASLTAGVRVTPAQVGLMPRVVSGVSGFVFEIAPSAHHWKLQGLEVSMAASGIHIPFLIHTSELTTFATIPHHITVDRCLIHPFETDPLPWRGAEQGISIDGRYIEITNNAIYDFFGWNIQTPIGTVASATNTSPVQVTTSTSQFSNPAHKFLVSFSGATGAWTGLNGTKVATFVSPTQVTLEDYTYPGFVITPVDSSGWGSFSGQTVSLLSQIFSTTRGILISVGPGPYVIENNLIEGYYTPIFTGGAGGTFIDPANQPTVTARASISQVTLSGLGDLAVDDLLAFSAVESQSVSAATAASPCRITVEAHRFPANTKLGAEGPGVQLSGATGSWAVVNSTMYIGRVFDSTHIDLFEYTSALDYSVPFNTTGFGSLTGTVTWKPKSKGGQEWFVGKVTTIGPGNQITYDYRGHALNPAAGNGIGVPVAVGATAQFNGIILDGMSIRYNTFRVRREWITLLRDVAGTGELIGNGPKGFWEVKMGVNVLVEGNIFEIPGPISDKTTPAVLAFNQVNQSGNAPYIEVSNWIIRSNLFLECGNSIIGHHEEYESGVASHDLLYENNLAIGFEGGFRLTATTNVTMKHNTWANRVPSLGTDYNAWITPIFTTVNTIIKDNIATQLNGYNPIETGPWTPEAHHNFLIGSNPAQYDDPPTVPSVAAMGFVDHAGAIAGGDYHGLALSPSSAYHFAASDGTDPGVDFDVLDAALAGTGVVVVAGGWGRIRSRGVFL